MKKMFMLVVAGAMSAMAAMAFAEPSVEITQVKLADAREGMVEYAYNVSGDFEGKYWDLVVKVTSGDGKESAVVTNECVTAGTTTKAVNVKALLGKAYPGVSLFAKLERNLGGVQLWADGPYFAECNIGATKPEEYGYYFWWGDTVGYKRNSSGDGWVSSKDGTTTIQFSSDTTAGQTCNTDNSTLQSEGWIDKSGNLVVTDDAATNRDAARAHLGAPWRMMTADEMQNLTNPQYCTSVWTNNYNDTGINGRLVKGNTEGYKDKSIFLPAAGDGSLDNLRDVGSDGHYWSSTPNLGNTYCAWSLYFGSALDWFNGSSDRRNYGYPVRPVRDEK